MNTLVRRSVFVIALLVQPALASAVTSSFSHVDPKAPCFRWPAVDMDGDGVFDRVDNCVSTPAGCTVDAYGCESDEDGDGVCDGVDQCPATAAGMKVDAKGCPSGQSSMRETQAQAAPAREIEKPQPKPEPASPPVSEAERQLVEQGRIRLENIYFETASANLLPESEASLNEAGQALEKFPDLELEVEGHTDTRGSERFNQRLSQARAEAVRGYLLSRFRLESANLQAKGYGETRPETQERNDEELLRNRRVEIRVLNPDVLPRGVKVENRN